MRTPASRWRQEQRARLDAISHPILLEAIFELLPFEEQCLSISRLGRSWREWAAPKLAELRQQLAGFVETWHPAPCPPLWFVREAWPESSEAACFKMLTCTARSGDVAAFAAVEALPLAERWQRPWARAAEQNAAASGSVELLTHLHQRWGVSFGILVCNVAAAAGRLEVVQWLRQREPPCFWDVSTCAAAARAGQLATLRWLWEQEPPCPWNKGTCVAAANSGHLEVLQWLRQQSPPCPWDAEVCDSAAFGGHVEVLQWLRQQEPPCPWSPAGCREAYKCHLKRAGHPEALVAELDDVT